MHYHGRSVEQSLFSLSFLSLFSLLHPEIRLRPGIGGGGLSPAEGWPWLVAGLGALNNEPLFCSHHGVHD